MENYLTAGDLALYESRKGYGYNYDGCGCGHYGYRHGAATTGIGLAAGLGGGALLLAIAGIWGVNQASKARAKAAEQGVNLVNSNLAQMSALQIAETQNRQAALAAERVSRETWQNYHAPTTTQFVDVRAGAGAFAGAGANSNAWAQAEANILSQTLTGGLSRCPQEISLVSKRSCPCPSSDCGCGN